MRLDDSDDDLDDDLFGGYAKRGDKKNDKKSSPGKKKNDPWVVVPGENDKNLSLKKCWTIGPIAKLWLGYC